MRKLISCFMMLSFLLTGISFYPNMVFAKDSNSGWEIKHKKYVVTNSGIVYLTYALVKRYRMGWTQTATNCIVKRLR
jgi:hypothetical protein